MENSPVRTIPALHFDTALLAAGDRFDAWRTAVALQHEVLPAKEEAPGPFAVRADVWKLDGLVATHGYYSAMRTARGARLVRNTGLAGYRLILPLAGGDVGLEIGDRAALFGPGTMYLTDLSQPDLQENRGPSEKIVLFLPRDAMDALLPQPRGLHGLALAGPLASLLRAHVVNLVGVLAATPAETASALAQATLQLVAAAISGEQPAGEDVRGAVDAVRRRRIIGYIDSRLGDPDLGQEELCRTFRMSRATLYRLFRPLGGVSAVVQDRRLARIHAALIDAPARPHLGRLAETHGFSSQAYMTRAFKARYACTPSEAAGLTPVLPMSTRGRSDYERWLRETGG